MSLARLWVSTGLYYAVTCGFLASAIYLFAKPPTYGSQPECNDKVIMVVFGVDIRATNVVFRWILVASLSCLLAGVVVSCIAIAFVFFFHREVGVANSSSHTNGDVDLDLDARSTRSPTSERPRKGYPYHLIGRLGGCVDIIAMLELIMKRNNVAYEERVWTFGQMLATMMLVGPVVEIMSLVLGRVGLDRRMDSGHHRSS
jgi:hypothetical protein